MSEPAKIVVLNTDELEALIKRAVQEALQGKNGSSGETMLNAEQAGQFLGFSRDWVYRNWQKIGGRKIGKRGIRFRYSELEAWVASRENSKSS